MDTGNYKAIVDEIKPYGARLVAISKTKPIEVVLEMYNQGQRIFGENRVQELLPKYNSLPQDIEWHLVGHLQSNKIKQIAPFISMIESVDSVMLLEEINKQAQRSDRVINCLLQIFIAEEKTKFGLSENELNSLLESKIFTDLKHIRICGLMGMATNTPDQQKIENEFKHLHQLFARIKKDYFADKPYFKELSIGMSSDYKIALNCGATLIRLGSLIFGER